MGDNDETVEGSQNSTKEDTIEPTDKTEEISEAKREVVRVKKVKTKNNQKNEVDVEVVVPEETSVEEKTDSLKSSPKSGSQSSRRESNDESKKQKSSTIDKTARAEINVESDGTFSKPKLKKAEAVKRHVEEPRLEKVHLKHHQFENEPQVPVEEETSLMKVSTPLSLSLDNVEKQNRTRSKIRKVKKKPSPDEVDKSASLPQEMGVEEITEVNKENQMPSVFAPKSEDVPVDFDDVETIEPDTNLEASISPVQEPSQLSGAKRNVKSVANSSKLARETQSMEEEGVELRKNSLQPEKAAVSEENQPAPSVSTDVPLVMESKIKEKKSSTREAHPELKIEEDGTYEIPQLRKAEVIKRPIPEAELESVDLFHHEFENEPQNPAEELPSNLVTRNPLSIDIGEKELKEQKKKKVVLKKKTKKEDVVSPIEDESEIQPTSGDGLESTTDIPLPESQDEPAVEKSEDSAKRKLETKEVKKKDGGKKSQPPKKEHPAEDGTFEKPKLKKSQTIKRAIEEPKLEMVSLKSHAFEKSPQDNPEEMRTMIRVARGLDIQIDSKK